MLLYTAAAMGIQISYHKGERGRKTTWIGIQFEIDVGEAAMVLSIPKKMLAELKAALEEWKNKGMVGLRQLRSFTGRASWLAGVLVRWRWVVSIMYAVIASHEKDVRSGEERRRAQNREDTRPKENLIPVKRLELPISLFDGGNRAGFSTSDPQRVAGGEGTNHGDCDGRLPHLELEQC